MNKKEYLKQNIYTQKSKITELLISLFSILVTSDYQHES